MARKKGSATARRAAPAKLRDLHVQNRLISELTPYAKNARTHSEAQVAQVVASIREFGWTNPILIDGEKGIIAGHARLEAARKLGMKEVPCIELTGLTEAQKRAYILADNRLALNAGWDEELLKLELLDLKELDFDLELTGFTDKELDNFLTAEPEATNPAVTINPGADLASLAPSDEERQRLSGRKIMVEFSGGKDSSAAAIWAKHYFPEAEIELCYVDLGAEYYGFSHFLQQFSEALGCDLNILRAPENVIDSFHRAGKWPIFIGPYCHENLHAPLDAHLTSHEKDKIVVVRGGRAQERAAQQGKIQTSRYLVIDRLKDWLFFQPLYFTTKDAAVGIVKTSGLPIWEGYGYGLQRTACRICPGQRPATYAAIRANFPQIWEELLELQRRMGAGAWQGSKEAGVRCTFEELADRGQEAFLEGGYKSF